MAALLARPPGEWRRITLANVGRILDRTVRVKGCSDDIRRIAVTDLGHEHPTLLITNRMELPAARLINRYARRMVIENAIADAIDFFHVDALPASVPMKVDPDLQLTLMASTLHRILAVRAGGGHETAKAHTLFRRFVNASANIRITETEINVTLGRRANKPLLLAAGTAERREPIPWLSNRIPEIRRV